MKYFIVIIIRISFIKCIIMLFLVLLRIEINWVEVCNIR